MKFLSPQKLQLFECRYTYFERTVLKFEVNYMNTYLLIERHSIISGKIYILVNFGQDIKIKNYKTFHDDNVILRNRQIQ